MEGGPHLADLAKGLHMVGLWKGLMGKGHNTFPPGLNWDKMDKIEAAGAYIINHNMLV